MRPCSFFKVCLIALALTSAGCTKREHQREHVFRAIPGQPDETPLWRDGDLVHSNRIGSEHASKALFWTWWFPVGLPAIWAALWWKIQRRRAKAERALVKGQQLADGFAVVQGVVETDDQSDAITVVITQKRHSYKDKQGNLHHEWNEKSRKVIAHPFRVRLPDQRVVVVEPNQRVLLRDKVEHGRQVDEDHRERNVRLRPGERVWATGRLSGNASSSGAAYREAPPTAVLKPERFARMIVSTEPPGAYFAERAKHHRAWARGLLLTMGIAQGTLFFDYSLQKLSGRPETMQIERIRTWDEWVKPKNQSGHWEKHYAADGQDSTGEVREFEISSAYYSCIEQRDCQTIPATRAWLSGGTLVQLGRNASIHLAQLISAGLVGWVLLFVYVFATRSSRPWYAGGKINGTA